MYRKGTQNISVIPRERYLYARVEKLVKDAMTEAIRELQNAEVNSGRHQGIQVPQIAQRQQARQSGD